MISYQNRSLATNRSSLAVSINFLQPLLSHIQSSAIRGWPDGLAEGRAPARSRAKALLVFGCLLSTCGIVQPGLRVDVAAY